jgi:mono/diheme cytochrome c family protein
MPFFPAPHVLDIRGRDMNLKPIIAIVAMSFCTAANADEVKTDLYTVVDGFKVDAATMKGFRTWRSAACDRCHGANQEGLVGPSLVNSLKVLTKEEFVHTVTEGRLEKGMVSFKTSKAVMDNLDNLYAYLKGRSDGAITRAKVEELK